MLEQFWTYIYNILIYIHTHIFDDRNYWQWSHNKGGMTRPTIDHHWSMFIRYLDIINSIFDQIKLLMVTQSYKIIMIYNIMIYYPKMDGRSMNMVKKERLLPALGSFQLIMTETGRKETGLAPSRLQRLLDTGLGWRKVASSPQNWGILVPKCSQTLMDWVDWSNWWCMSTITHGKTFSPAILESPWSVATFRV